MSLKNLSAVLKCMGNDDLVTLKADDDGDKLCLMFENPGQRQRLQRARFSLPKPPRSAARTRAVARTLWQCAERGF